MASSSNVENPWQPYESKGHIVPQHLLSMRWTIMSPLQKRIQINTTSWGPWDFTLGEAIVVLASSSIFLLTVFRQGMITQGHYPTLFYEPTGQHQSGHISAFALALTFATAAHNSVFTLLLGLPFDRAIHWHK